MKTIICMLRIDAIIFSMKRINFEQTVVLLKSYFIKLKICEQRENIIELMNSTSFFVILRRIMGNYNYPIY